MYDKVKRYIERYNMIRQSEHVIAGLSGGADSVCLLFMLKRFLHEQSGEEYRSRLTAVHVHHGIRGEEAGRDMEFVKRLCEQEGVGLVIRFFDVPEYSREHRISCEEAGRLLRYQAMGELAAERGNNTKIAVAHNSNDNAETVLHNLSRGTGLKGLGGIAPLNGSIVRPLLCLERKEIENYLADNKISYIIDSTNLETEYTRNRIRLHVLSVLQQEINPKCVEHIRNASENVREAEEFLEKITNQMYEKVIYTDNNCICIKKEELHPMDIYIKKRIIRQAVGRIAGGLKDITVSHIKDVLELMTGEPGKYIYLPGGIIVRNDYNRLILEHKESFDKRNEQIYVHGKTIILKPGIYRLEGYEYCFEVSEFYLDSEEEAVKFLKNCIKKQKNLYTKCFDYDKMKFAVQLRYRMSGDFLTIDSRGSHKKLKSYFVDEKIPQKDRGRIPLLADGKHIIWVVGGRISEDYKITESTRHVLKIERKDII